MILTVTIFCIGIPGNLFVVYVFGWKNKQKTRRKNSHTDRGGTSRFEFLLLILGCIDLVSLLLVPPFFFYLTVAKFRVWHFGEVACKIVPSLLQVTVSVSQGMMVLICYERYSAIVYPFDHKTGISTFRIFAWLCNVVFVSAVFIYPYAYAFEIRSGEFGPSCEPVSARLNYFFASACLQVSRDMASMLTMIVLSHRMNRALVRPHDSEDSVVVTTTTTTATAMTSWDRARMSAKSRKVIKTVVAVFTILCLPVDLFHLVYYTLIKVGIPLLPFVDSVIHPVNTLLNIMQISNSAANVFIYSKMHVFFRKMVLRKGSR